jgi:DNA-binding XRE family transcriptional regulator
MLIKHSVETGEDVVVLSRDEYEDLIDARRHEATMRGVVSGAVETVSEADARAYLDAPTPLAFWRKHRGMTQVQLAEAAGISQPYLAQLENGQREAMGSVYARLARRLGVRIDDLLVDEE